MPFPDEIVRFPQMIDMTPADAEIVSQYQRAMEAGNIELASRYLAQIPQGQQKVITAEYINKLASTCVDVQNHFLKRYSNGYIVSADEPIAQQQGDFWFQIL